MSVSLEDQRRALLEQIEASRAVYRRMLSGENAAGSARLPVAPRAASAYGRAVDAGSANWRTLAPAMRGGLRQDSRGKAVQWAMDHPLWVAAGVALLVWLLPRAVEARRQRTRARQQRSASLGQAVQAAQGSGTGRALLTAALLLLRDPARLRAAGRLASVGWRWLQRWRTH